MRRTRHLAAAAALAVAAALLAAPAPAAPTWLPSVGLSASGQYVSDQQVAVDPLGNATAVWLRSDGANYRIEAATRPAGAQWSTPTILSTAGQDTGEPQVVVDAAGTATAVWEQYGAAADKIMESTRPAGGAWSAPLEIATAAQDDVGDPRLAVDGTGQVTAVWNILDSGTRRIQARTRTPGAPWAPAVFLSAAGAVARQHSVAGRPGAGGVTAVWMRPEGADDRIQVSSRSADGSWSDAVNISGPGQDAAHPAVAVHPDGDVTAVWSRSDGTNARVQARTRRGALSWFIAPVTTLSAEAQDADHPDVAVAADGATTAVWTRYDGFHARVQAATRPEGGAWTLAADTLSQAGEMAWFPEVVVDGAGNATAVWSRHEGADLRVQASRRPAGGAWGASSSLSAPGYQSGDPTAAVDSAGDVVVVWAREGGVATRVESAALDVSGPSVTGFVVPATATAGRPAATSVSAVDTWSPISGTAWSFGDGATASGPSVSHTWTNPGTYTVTATVSDAVGNTTTRQATIAVAPAAVVAPPAPRITRFRLKPRTIEINGPRKKTRTRVTLVLTTDARVKIVVRKRGAKKAAARLAKALKAGKNTFRLTTRIGKKRLKPGTYKLTARATNAAGTSRPVTVRLRVVR